MTDTDEHEVTAVEPAWTKQTFVPDDDGSPEPVGQFETMDIIDGMFQESEYECTCGEPLDSWSEVEDHFAEVAE